MTPRSENMAPWLLASLLLVASPLRGGAQQVAPCTFNSMCTCKFGSNEAVVVHLTTPRTLDQMRDVSCVGVSFSRLPGLPIGPVSHVDIVSSGLEAVEADIFGDAQVESLRLMSNRIQVVAPRAFTSMQASLRSLDLSYNELDEVPFEALHSIKELDWLNLHSNQIASLDGPGSDWLRICESITNMFLGENELTELPLKHNTENGNGNGMGVDNLATNGNHHYVWGVTSLADCTRLSWLNLDSNKLRYLEPGSLPPHLQALSVSHNLLTHFPAEALDRQQHLVWLYLRDNYMEELPEYTFKRIQQLEILDLGDNNLHSLPNSLFNSSLNVRDLKMDYNYLTGIPAQAFRGLNVGKIYLSMNKLDHRQIDDRAFVGVGHTLELLDLEHNELDEVPQALFHLKRLKNLYIPSNNISDLGNKSLQGFSSTLKVLSLAGNKLTRIPQDALKDCTNLLHLNIGYNRIDEVRDADFETWGASLDTLLLRNNLIARLDSNLFKYTPRLRELSLSFNQISEIQSNAFSDLSSSLESLEISFGLDYEDFPVEILKPLISLSWLALDNNEFRTIRERDLYSFSKLQYLNLESNKLSKLPPGLFHDKVHSELRDVRLSYNLLETLEPDTLVGLPSLQTAVLMGNRLRSIHSAAIRDMELLVTLILSDNRLSTIAPRAMQNLPNLLRLDLQGNELKEVYMSSFLNVTSEHTPMMLNLSHNQLTVLFEGDSEIYLRNLDLSHNQLPEVPVNFLQHLTTSLRRLHLGYNRIPRIDSRAFGPLPLLEVLTLPHNNIVTLRAHAFLGAGDSLQHLDLSHNHVETLQVLQFGDLPLLRVLDLSHNHIRSIPRDAFKGTKLERLDLSHNELVVMPSGALIYVGDHLRQLSLSHNHIEHLDSTMFQETPNLFSLNVANNKLTILPDNVFNSLGNLLSLDLSSNPLRANFKELFHYLQGLRRLNLADTGIRVLQPLPLPFLVSLNLTDNSLTDLSPGSVQNLGHLRVLLLDGNQLSSVPAQAWPFTPRLRYLSLERNPIKVVTKESFAGLGRLQELYVDRLERLERFDADSLTWLPLLTTLRIQTWPSIEKYRFRLGGALSSLSSLRRLCVNVRETALTDQLLGAFTSKLRRLEISGSSLRSISPDALDGIQNKYELALQIQGTQIHELSPGLVARLSKIAQLSLDLRNNRLTTLSPSSLYPNGTSWENVGTRPYAGGLVLSGNPWTCECGLVWLGRWLRRWLRETMQIHTAVLEGAQEMTRLVRQSTCWDARTGRQVPLLELRAEDLACHPSALSHGGSARVHCPRSAFLDILVPLLLTLRAVLS